MQVQPYLQFDGRCEEALEFYKSALGAKVETIIRFKDGPDCMEMPQGTGDKVLHSWLRIGETAIMASDGYCKGKPDFQGFSLSIIAPDKNEADRLFKALDRAARCRCRSPRRSSRRASARLPTASASRG